MFVAGKITVFSTRMCCISAKTQEDFSLFYRDLKFFMIRKNFVDREIVKTFKNMRGIWNKIFKFAMII